jgi:hypothetical protein
LVLTDEPLKTGQLVEGQIAGLIEQFEDEQEHHNVLVTLPGEPLEISPTVNEALTSFVLGVIEHVPGKRISVGRFLPAQEAVRYVSAPLDHRSC